MKILVTGTKELAQELAFVYAGHDATSVSRSTGHDINKIEEWGVTTAQQEEFDGGPADSDSKNARHMQHTVTVTVTVTGYLF